MRPVIYGEVLFDNFPDSSILGGAAFNVAWHLRGFGADPLFISCIGDDSRGERVIEAMNDWGMDVAAVQQDTHYPTGQVRVDMVDDDHCFTIIPDQAYDFIDKDIAVKALPDDAALLYHGSLITRNTVSREALHAVRNTTSAPICVDINLRTPWWDKEHCLNLMQSAAWIKLNSDELAEFACSDDRHCIIQRTKDLRRALNTDVLVVTRSENGAQLFERGDHLSCTPKEAIHVVDTVGAGDSFTSVMLFGKLKGWPLSVALQRAQDFAQEVCRYRGAIIRDHNLYDTHLQHWEQEDAARPLSAAVSTLHPAQDEMDMPRKMHACA